MLTLDESVNCISEMCYSEILSTATEYNIYCLDVSIGQIKHCISKTFVDSIV